MDSASTPPKPSTRQATCADGQSHPLLHTVPQMPWNNTSSLPSLALGPAASRSGNTLGLPGCVVWALRLSATEAGLAVPFASVVLEGAARAPACSPRLAPPVGSRLNFSTPLQSTSGAAHCQPSISGRCIGTIEYFCFSKCSLIAAVDIRIRLSSSGCRS